MNQTPIGGDYPGNKPQQADLVNSEWDMPDDLLVLECQAGDETAFNQLIARWQERLWRCALRLTGDEQAAWDILQETCIALARDLPKLDRQAAFAAWAYGIVRHKVRDWWRQDTRRRQRESVFAERLQSEGHEEAAWAERADALKSALQRLEEPERALLALRFEDGFHIDEIASILEVPAGTVKSRLHHIRQRLRTLMEKNT